ncbi:P-loop containing nucleoside triphosphate hydrolase protein [Dipodascopsis tothii]|uniref:P-loop containing nucleoside triphosphate hydrolase protein n=1 Tax=Dipodascopsis tothii TaxID=44089 RepID=UPI0034CF659B
MAPLTAAKIEELQSAPECVRNICILAHVDHGKTSLSDSLLATNGIISQKLAGKVRYLDSREDEQMRGITMESSAISLYFRTLNHAADGTTQTREHLINLIDSPGHIDFSSEVSTASRLCDGALVLVDAVEGVCSQTVTVLRQTWTDRLRPILVLNKIDRLVLELQLTPAEAYHHLARVLEQVNAVVGSFYASERMEQDVVDEDEDDEHLYFAPEKNNVIFASALDGWGFTVSQFAVMYEKKLGMKRAALEKVLWGDYYFDAKAKRVVPPKLLKGRPLKLMFVQFVLEYVWAVYESTVVARDADKTERIVKGLGLKVLPRDLRAKDARALLSTIFAQWLPVSTAVLITVIDKIESPAASQRERVPTILASSPHADALAPAVRAAMVACDPAGPVAAYVSKMVSVPEDALPRQRAPDSPEDMRERTRLAREAARRAQAAAEERAAAGDDAGADAVADEFEALKLQAAADAAPRAREVMVGFARVYSGTLAVGQEIYVLGPKYSPAHPDRHVDKVTITALYLLMGRELVALDRVPAGNVVGIGGLGGIVLKSATVFSVPGGVNLAGVTMTTAPIVRVALEPENPWEIPQLEAGLRLLNQADPCVQVLVQESGEHIMVTAGELHLERCLKDLRERFAGIDISCSEPLVPYRESIVRASGDVMGPPRGADAGLPRGTSIFRIADDRVAVRLTVRPLPAAVTDLLLKHKRTLQTLAGGAAAADDPADADDVGLADRVLTTDELRAALADAFKTDTRYDWKDAVDRICAFGPKNVGPNVLVDATAQHSLRPLVGDARKRTPFDESVATAFQLATAAGPLCAEPVQGVAVVLESVARAAVAADDDEETAARVAAAAADTTPVDDIVAAHDPRVSGQALSHTREAFRAGFLDWSPRILLAMYSCEIQAQSEVLGRVYTVIAQRRGRVLSEEMKEGTPFFVVRAQLPVVESFGFAEDIRKRSSGAASPQLIFAGFEMLDEDPFWVPTTEEELEELGEFAERENVAKRYMDAVRRRKGIFVDEKLVKNAEKQRTMKR